MEFKNENKESKLVFDARIARTLCKAGFPIIDIKPLRNDPNRTVFVFENTENFQKNYLNIREELKAKDLTMVANNDITFYLGEDDSE